MSLDEGLDKQSYEIIDELKIRKILEKHTEWDFVFRKNGKYDYDLRLYRYDQNPSSEDDREVYGYIELERASKENVTYPWITGDIPDGWSYLSFLERKVREYNRAYRRWEGLKDDYRRTVYLKFNHSLDSCFVAPVASVYRDGQFTKKSDGSRTNTYRKLDRDHPDIRYGIRDSVEFIEEYLGRIDDKQTGFEEFAGGEADD